MSETNEASVQSVVMRREYPASQEWVLRQMGLDSLRGLVFNIMQDSGVSPREIAEMYKITKERVQKLRRTSFTTFESQCVAKALRDLANFLDPPA
jgi:hypothetical protein